MFEGNLRPVKDDLRLCLQELHLEPEQFVMESITTPDIMTYRSGWLVSTIKYRYTEEYSTSLFPAWLVSYPLFRAICPVVDFENPLVTFTYTSVAEALGGHLKTMRCIDKFRLLTEPAPADIETRDLYTKVRA